MPAPQHFDLEFLTCRCAGICEMHLDMLCSRTWCYVSAGWVGKRGKGHLLPLQRRPAAVPLPLLSRACSRQDCSSSAPAAQHGVGRALPCRCSTCSSSLQLHESSCPVLVANLRTFHHEPISIFADFLGTRSFPTKSSSWSRAAPLLVPPCPCVIRVL